MESFGGDGADAADTLQVLGLFELTVGLSCENDASGECGADVGEEEDLFFGGGVEGDALVSVEQCVDVMLGAGWVCGGDCAEE